MKIFKYGKYFYLLGLAVLVCYQFLKGDIAMTRPPFSAELAALNPLMAYISGTLIFVSIILILLKKQEAKALITISLLIFCLVTLRHIANFWSDEINAFKSLWLIAGALLLLSNLKGYTQFKPQIHFFSILILFLFFYHSGIAHFQFTDFVITIIPDYIPFKLFFTYFAGVCLILTAIGLLIPKIRSITALLASIQILIWFLLLHIPRAISIGGDEWIGVGESLAVAGICFVLSSKHFNS